MKIGIIGAGPGGMALGILLARAGFGDFTIFDREDGVGGTWRINTYPGLACDVKSHLYSFSFDLNPNWSRLWSEQPEILDYFERCADANDLRPHLKLRTQIDSAGWDADTRRWCLTTNTGEQHWFDVVFSAVGLFTEPVLPDLPEEEQFTGTVMHSARWDHSVRLTGARIAVLGTGSTASQLVPELAKTAERVYSIQRSPTWILPKPDRPYSPRERWLFARVPWATRLYRARLWLRSERNISVIENGSDKTQEFKAAALSLLESTVADQDLRRSLTPDHPLGCKRLVFSSEYLRALTLPNVEVVSSPARALRARSLIMADGTEREVDIVVCATGYAATDYLGQIDVVGENGTTLREVWRDGAHAHLGMAVPGFPNFFMLYGPNTNVGSNSVIFVLEAQARYLVRALRYMRRKRKSYVAVRPAVMADFLAKVDRWMQGTVWTTRCHNYFRAPNGRVVTQWPRSAGAFWAMTRRFRPGDYRFEAPAALAPEIRAMAPPRTDLSADLLPAVRESLNQRRRAAAHQSDPAGVCISEAAAGSVPVRIYRGGTGRGVLYCHSGAFVLGNLDTDHRQCLELARRGQCTVVSVDYRLAPEHPYPAALNDAVSVLDWMVDNSGDLGVDASRIAVAGSSAGAGLAAGIAQRAACGAAPSVVLQLLHQPVLDDRATSSKAEFTTTPGLDAAAAESMWRHYLGATPPSAQAVPARWSHLAGSAPALITCASQDPLRDEAVGYAGRLRRAGVRVDLHEFPGTCHGFDALLPDWEVSQRLFELQGAALRRL